MRLLAVAASGVMPPPMVLRRRTAAVVRLWKADSRIGIAVAALYIGLFAVLLAR